MRREEKSGLEKAHHAAMEAAARLRLPLSSRTWRGHTGNWAGVGIGSSIDFQDHRPYLPGDDPRYINWQAYARSGHYAMKLYREEVSPQIDLLLDASVSMFFEDAKHRRSWELFFFCRECALKAGSSLRAFASSGNDVIELRHEQLAGFDIELPSSTDGPPVMDAVPWRSGSLRILVSDLLFQSDPIRFFTPLSHGRGRGLVFCPWTYHEEDPDWNGNLSLIDCETGERRNQLVNTTVMSSYKRNYSRHFEEWKQEAARHGVPFARINCEENLLSELLGEPLYIGATEIASGG